MDMESNQGQGSYQLFRYEDTKGTCLICFNPVVELGLGSRSPNNYSGNWNVVVQRTSALWSICRHLELNMELVEILICREHKGPPEDLKVAMCEECGRVVGRLSLLLKIQGYLQEMEERGTGQLLRRKQELTRMAIRYWMGVLEKLLLVKEIDLGVSNPAVKQFRKLMSADEPLSDFDLEAMRVLRRVIADKCSEEASSTKYRDRLRLEIRRLTSDSFGNGTPEASLEGVNPAGAEDDLPPSSDSAVTPDPGSPQSRISELAPDPDPETTASLPESESENEAPSTQDFLCRQCGTSFMFPTNLQLHMEIKHGNGMVREAEPPQPAVQVPNPSELRKFKCSYCQERFRFKTTLTAHVRKKHLEFGPRPSRGPPNQGAHPNVLSSPSSQPMTPTHFDSTGGIEQEAVVGPGEGTLPPIYEDVEGEWKPIFSAETGLYGCPICSSEFTRRVNCRMHFLALHLKFRLSCEICDQTFPRKTNLWRHHQTVHLRRRRTCTYCSRTFSMFCLRPHMKICKARGVSPPEAANV